MFVVLGAILVVTLLGFAGLALARSDASNSGSILDLRSRDQAAWSGIQLALARMQANPVNTATQLSRFLSDVSTTSTNVRDRFAFTATGFSFEEHNDGHQWYRPLTTLSGTDSTATSVVLLSVDIGTPVAGALQSNGIVVTLQSTGKGRNGDLQTVVASYRMLGISMQQNAASTTTSSVSNALYLSGNLNNTNLGTNIAGDVYVSGNVSLNAPAPIRVAGRFRVNGNFNSNARLTVTGNSWIGGYIYTNSGAPMTFEENLGIGGGFQVMNDSLTVKKSLNVYGSASINWNGTRLIVGDQLFVRDQYFDIGGSVAVRGNAFFGNSLQLRGSAPDTFYGFLGVGGSFNDNIFQSGNLYVLGDLDFTGSRPLDVNGANLYARQNLQMAGSLKQTNSGQIVVDQSARILGGISGIGEGNLSNAISIGDALYLNATNQASYNGGLYAGNRIWMTGTIDGSFSQNTGNSQWNLSSTGSREWSYQNGSVPSTGENPRVRNSSKNNTDARNSLSGSFPTLITPPAGQPYGLTSITIGMSSIDTMTSLAANPPDTFVVSSAKSPAVDAARVRLTDTLCAAAGARTNNWRGEDFNKIYSYLDSLGMLLNGFMVLQIHSSSSLSNVEADSSTGLFTGKAVFIVEKSINVNGKWPGSADSNAIQVVYVRGSGSLGEFGSQKNIYGLVFYENAQSGTQKWGPNSKLFGSMQFANGASLTGNSGNLSISLDQSVFNKISSALPSALRTVNGSSTPTTVTVTYNPTVVVAEQGAATRIQFIRLNAYR